MSAGHTALPILVTNINAGFPGGEGFPDVCTSPAYSVGPDNPEYFGKCLFNEFHPGDTKLADDLLEANKMPGAETTFAKRDGNITEYEKR